MQLTRLHLKNFRCFPRYDLVFESPITLISGDNGTGKTSLLEALHYACYLRSFRTGSPRELMAFNGTHFFIKLSIAEGQSFELSHELNIGFTNNKKVISLDKRAINSYKELTDYCRIITITEDDLSIIKSGPDVRRTFIDQALTVLDHSFITKLQRYKHILKNRNAAIQSPSSTHDSYAIWTEQLWQQSTVVQEIRQRFLDQLQVRVNQLLASLDYGVTATIKYRAKRGKEGTASSKKAGVKEENFQDFFNDNGQLFAQEKVMGWSLFGAHLDDISITFHEKAARSFASRGQQKLLILLLKIAQLQELMATRGPAVLLLDDFMTDFDGQIGERVLNLLTSLSIQLIFTTPVTTGVCGQGLLEKGAQHVTLTR